MLKKIRYPIFFKTRNVFYFSQNEPKNGGKQPQEEIKPKSETKSEGRETFQDRLEKRLREIDKIKMEVRNQLVLQKKESHEKEKSTKALRDSILFEEVLTKNVDLCLYDCLGYAYRRFCLKNLAWMSILAFVVLLISLSDNVKKKNKNKTLILGSLWLGLGLFFMRRFQKNHVERIIYHTNEKKFTLVKKTFFGGEKNVVVHKNNLMYTQDESLNRKNVNYINVENLETYKIGFVYAWKEKELFAYLIGQNVK